MNLTLKAKWWNQLEEELYNILMKIETKEYDAFYEFFNNTSLPITLNFVFEGEDKSGLRKKYFATVTLRIGAGDNIEFYWNSKNFIDTRKLIRSKAPWLTILKFTYYPTKKDTGFSSDREFVAIQRHKQQKDVTDVIKSNNIVDNEQSPFKQTEFEIKTIIIGNLEKMIVEYENEIQKIRIGEDDESFLQNIDVKKLQDRITNCQINIKRLQEELKELKK